MRLFAQLLAVSMAIAPAGTLDATVSAPNADSVGFSEALLRELTTPGAWCGCSLISNNFPKSVTFGNCADGGGPGTSSLTEATACIPPSSGDETQCVVAGTVTWTPGCIPCCGTSACEWRSSGSPLGSTVTSQSTSPAGLNQSFWTNCTSGALTAGNNGDCEGFGGPSTITIRAEITDCATGATLTCPASGALTTQWLCEKVYECR